MFEAAAVLGMYAETALHPGSGQPAGVIDLAIQRESHTGFPMYASSGVKGTMRNCGERWNRCCGAGQRPLAVEEIFGPETGKGDDHAGAISPTDARLLLFPLRSLDGIFVWATCPFAIHRWHRDRALAGLSSIAWELRPVDRQALIAADSDILRENETLVFEGEDFARLSKTTNNDDAVRILADEIAGIMPNILEYKPFIERLPHNMVVISNERFADLTFKSTASRTRIKLNDKKTTTGGGGNMWVEEFLPSDTLLYSVVLAMPSRKPTNLPSKDGGQILSELQTAVGDNSVMQIGGNESVGAGWVRLRWQMAAASGQS